MKKEGGGEMSKRNSERVEEKKVGLVIQFVHVIVCDMVLRFLSKSSLFCIGLFFHYYIVLSVIIIMNYGS